MGEGGKKGEREHTGTEVEWKGREKNETRKGRTGKKVKM